MKKASSRPRDRQPEPAPRYWTGTHTTHKLRSHLVLVLKYRKRVLPKYRKRVLRGEVAARLEALIRQACTVNGWEPEELAVQPDHAHLLLQVPPRFSVMQIMKTLKGGTARVLRQEFPGLEEYPWGDNFWAEGYFLGGGCSRGQRGDRLYPKPAALRLEGVGTRGPWNPWNLSLI